MSTRVSIVIPVFNGANYLGAAIDSALAQTWQDTEIIVVNDGSIDDGQTEAIALAYGDKIRYIHKPNGGVASALNAGIEAMTGDVFCWLSHDDRHLPNKTTLQVAQWEKHGRSPVVLISDYRLIDESGKMIADVRLDHAMIESKSYYALLRGCIHGCSVFVPRCILEQVGGFDTQLPTTQDYDLWSRVIRQYPFVHIPEILIESRWHDEQDSKKIDHIEEATKFWLRVIADTPSDLQVALEGNRYRFLLGMANFLGRNQLIEAAHATREMAAQQLLDTLVTIVIPVFNRANLAVSALESVLAQTHANTEIIVVDDGSTADMSLLTDAIASFPSRVRMLHQQNRGPAAARNAGWAAAQGRFVAFLDSDDLFLPTKISTQLRAMEEAGAAFSHTSYFRCWNDSLESLTQVESGIGNAFPDIIAGCSIATPTTMILTSLRDEGFRFPEDIRIGEDVALWIRIASTYGVFGIDSRLTIVRANEASAAYDTAKQALGVANILANVRSDPSLAGYAKEVERLDALAKQLAAQAEEGQ